MRRLAGSGWHTLWRIGKAAIAEYWAWRILTGQMVMFVKPLLWLEWKAES
jgi:hypothetical protein